MTKKKIAWITGASSGIGEATSREYANHGYKLIISSRRKDELERLSKELDTEVFVLDFDVTDIEHAVDYAKRAVGAFGKVDVLVLNAGLSQRSKASETELEVDRKIMEVNYFGQVALAKAMLPFFRKNQSGHYVVVTSLSAKFGFFLRSAYSASKHALHGFFESLRLEEEENGIHVTLVCPTLIKTNISKNALDGTGNEFGKRDPLQEGGISPEECAKAIYHSQQRKMLEVVVGKKKISVLIKRLFPNVFHGMIRKRKPY